MKSNNKRKLLEGLRHGDLVDLVEDNVSIDRYRSKMGTDDEVVVVAFKCLHKDAAHDLVEFIESGYDWVLDANQAPATDREGKVTVFVEFNRRMNASKNIIDLLEEITYLSQNENWTFSYYKNEYPEMVNEENLEIVPKSPQEYRDRLMQEQELDDLMKASGLDPAKRYKSPPKGEDVHFLQSLVSINKGKSNDKK